MNRREIRNCWKAEEVRRIKENVSPAKDRLISALNELEALGKKREAKTLENIIIKLEVWQNR